MIYNLIKDVTPVETDNTMQYNVPVITFMQAYENTVNLENSYNITITLTKKDDKINKATIDLTNYDKAKGIINNYILTISYYNIDKINNFTNEYDELIGVEE